MRQGGRRQGGMLARDAAEEVANLFGVESEGVFEDVLADLILAPPSA